MNRQPFIPASKLVEYCFAASPRRTAIIESLLEPPAYIMDTGYPDIEKASGEFIASRGTNNDRLCHLDNALLLREPKSDREEKRFLNAHDAIELVQKMALEYPANASLTALDRNKDSFSIAGVDVRINPTVSLRAPQKGSKEHKVGFGKVYFGKSFPLSDKVSKERGSLFASLLHWYADVAALGQVSLELCFVADVFTGDVHIAPKGFEKRRKMLLASAQEVADRWETIRARLEVTKHTRAARS
jgi:hypothetical protein